MHTHVDHFIYVKGCVIKSKLRFDFLSDIQLVICIELQPISLYLLSFFGYNILNLEYVAV